MRLNLKAIGRAAVTAFMALALMVVIWESMALALFYLPVPWGIIAAFAILLAACVLMIWIADKRHPVFMSVKGAHQCQPLQSK